MPKTKKSTKKEESLFSSEWLESVRESAEELVDEVRSLLEDRQKARERIEEKLEQWREELKNRQKEVQERFDGILSPVFSRIGLPTQKDLKDLHTRLDRIESRISGKGTRKRGRPQKQVSA